MTTQKLSAYQQLILEKIAVSTKPFFAYGLQIRTCQSLKKLGLVYETLDGEFRMTRDGIRMIENASLAVLNGQNPD